MSLRSQILKGILEGCILAIIRRRSVYGYELAETLKRYGLVVSEVDLSRFDAVEGGTHPRDHAQVAERPQSQILHADGEGSEALNRSSTIGRTSCCRLKDFWEGGDE